MRAIVKTAPGEGNLELLEWQEPEPGADEVKIRVAAAGICGTDIHILKGNWHCRPPVVLGHEWCGTVVDVGARVTRFRPGDRVVASNPARTCGACYHCLAGNPFMCAERVSAGYMIDGAFAEYLCIDARRCHQLPAHVSFREAALGEPLAVAVHAAIERTTVRAGDLVLVSGPGCIGLLTLIVAKLQGGRVILAGLDRDRARLACGRDLGADLVVNVEREDLPEIVREVSGGEGADLVFECAGSVTSLENCWQAVRKGGTVVSLGVHSAPICTDFGKVMMKELQVVGSYGYVWSSWARTVRLLAEGRINAAALITHEYSLEQFRAAFELAQNGAAIKVVLSPEMAWNGGR
ncbi:MAG: zinc-binding dehydrogenase [Acidobacteriota bacterium]